VIDIKFEYSHSLTTEVRANVVSRLYILVATYSDAYGVIHEAHWNSEDKGFISLHLLYDQVLDTISPYIDALSERVRALGTVAFGNTRFVMENTVLPPYTMDYDLYRNLDNVISILGIISGLLYENINSIDSIDKVTSNMLQDQAREIDKLIYLVRSNVCKEEAMESPQQEAMEGETVVY